MERRAESSPRPSSGPRVGVCAIAIWALLAGCPTMARAQVMEIGQDGAVTVHDRPEVFSAGGATPIQPAVVKHARRAGRRANTTDISHAATAAALSPSLIRAVAWRESHMTPGVVSSAGAIGEMQLTPATARALGVNPYDTRQNLDGGAAYLRVLMQHYDGDLIRSLAAYNAGPRAVDRYGGVPPYKETQAYVADILALLSDQAFTDAGDQADRKR